MTLKKEEFELVIRFNRKDHDSHRFKSSEGGFESYAEADEDGFIPLNAFMFLADLAPMMSILMGGNAQQMANMLLGLYGNATMYSETELIVSLEAVSEEILRSAYERDKKVNILNETPEEKNKRLQKYYQMKQDNVIRGRFPDFDDDDGGSGGTVH